MSTIGFVGKSKVGNKNAEHSWGGGALPLERSAVPPPARGGITRTSAEQLYFQLKEFEDFRQPSFNVLYVQTPRPGFSQNPLFQALATVISDTGELLQPLMRLGIPRSSLKDKLPYFREDYSPLPNTVRPRVQKVLRLNIQFAEQMAAATQQVADEWTRLKKARKEAKRAGNKPLPVPQQLAALEAAFEGGGHPQHSLHIPHARFYTHEMPTWMVPALNLLAYAYLCGGLFSS
ncbi:hypothetical protein V8C86DRAFT_2574566 [Haematococcus lacustris]|uniref:Uncharacterized protein n=2 Tax=Haematococcus lacustris TaxID=44745 RepID=A0A6A0AAR4_HAELA|nr:uncharacterized protein HaLaN_27603 [Haematococcus lacustris]